MNSEKQRWFPMGEASMKNSFLSSANAAPIFAIRSKKKKSAFLHTNTTTHANGIYNIYYYIST